VVAKVVVVDQTISWMVSSAQTGNGYARKPGNRPVSSYNFKVQCIGTEVIEYAFRSGSVITCTYDVRNTTVDVAAVSGLKNLVGVKVGNIQGKGVDRLDFVNPSCY
jgi:hypothetical protein